MEWGLTLLYCNTMTDFCCVNVCVYMYVGVCACMHMYTPVCVYVYMYAACCRLELCPRL